MRASISKIVVFGLSLSLVGMAWVAWSEQWIFPGATAVILHPGQAENLDPWGHDHSIPPIDRDICVVAIKGNGTIEKQETPVLLWSDGKEYPAEATQVETRWCIGFTSSRYLLKCMFPAPSKQQGIRPVSVEFRDQRQRLHFVSKADFFATATRP